MYVSADAPDTVLEVYLNIVFSFSRGVVRIWGAEAASARLLGALRGFREFGQPGLDGPAAPILQHLARVPHNAAESLEYVTNVSHLVYATALLDTFLSQTTQFLFLLIPRAMGENQPVPLRALIDVHSKNEAITQAALARVREIDYLPFADRIQFLRDTFGLQIALSLETAKGLARCSSVRQSATHDQASTGLRLDDLGNIVSGQDTDFQPPKFSSEESHRTIESYEQASRAVAEAVFSQILKQGDHPAVQLVLQGSTARIALRT